MEAPRRCNSGSTESSTLSWPLQTMHACGANAGCSLSLAGDGRGCGFGDHLEEGQRFMCGQEMLRGYWWARGRSAPVACPALANTQ